jgi:uncharacterized protein
MSTFRVTNRLRRAGPCRVRVHKRRIAEFGVLLLAVLLFAGPAGATRVPGLYGADVDATGASGSGLDAAFDAALGQVLVKLTGLPDGADPAKRKRLFPNPAALVQKYTVQPGNRLRVEFDPTAMRRALDSAGLPLWDIDRPLVIVWLAIDGGEDARFILPDGAAADPQLAGDTLVEFQQALQGVARERGLPLVLPLLDANDITRVTFADVRDEVREPILAASERYGAEAVLIGRSGSLDINAETVRWTLLAGEEEASWEGTVASGPAEAAAVLSRQLATYADAGGARRVIVTGIDSFPQYGSLLQYFRSLPIVERASISRVDGQSVEFELEVRGDTERLRRTLDTSALLVGESVPAAAANPVPAGTAPASAAPASELVYSLRTAR